MTRRIWGAAIAMAAIGWQSVSPAAAQVSRKPLWEIGLGVGALSFPDYIGSDRQRTYVLPVPYLIYRGEFIKADRNGVRARLFGTDRLESYLSLNGSPPVNSTDNAARSGMPNLSPTVEFGPALDVHLWASDTQRTRIDFRVPVRTAITVQVHPRQVGWLLTPVLNVDVGDVGGFAGWNLGMQAGPVFADRSYNETFYGVAPAYASPTRPAYVASGGYAGSQFTMAVSKRFSTFWTGAFLRYNDLRGAVFEDSPLVRQRQNLSAGIGIAWVLGQSRQEVESND